MFSSFTTSSFNSVHNFLMSSQILGSFENWIKIAKTYILGSWIEVHILILFICFKICGCSPCGYVTKLLDTVIWECKSRLLGTILATLESNLHKGSQQTLTQRSIDVFVKKTKHIIAKLQYFILHRCIVLRIKRKLYWIHIMRAWCIIFHISLRNLLS